MGYTFSFEKLHVWNDSKDLVLKIYNLTQSFPEAEKFGLTSQLRRAAVSIASNLAEGTSRNTNKDKSHFVTIAYSSLMEVLNQIIISYELKLINNDDYQNLRQEIEKIANKINALKKAYN